MPAWTSISTVEPMSRWSWAKLAAFLACLTPAALMLLDAVTGSLGSNPIETIIHRSGTWGLAYLIGTLALTPVRQLTGWNWIIRFRRMLGLYGFFFVCLHIASYVVLDQFFDWAAILDDIVKRPYITIGLTGFVLLIPLAMTSTDRMMRRLGGKRWKRLHRLAYLAPLAGGLHFLALVKADLREPLVYLGILLALLCLRMARELRRSSLLAAISVAPRTGPLACRRRH